jgi:outer membrane cobalamin receptor
MGWVLLMLFTQTVWGQEQGDTTLNIKEVVVTSKLTFREVIPSQKLHGEQLQRLSSLSVADAMRYFSGVQLKDYGGVGGVKTVDVRAMGTNHLGVSYDGITLGNAQNGQIDLGQFSLDNIDEIALYNGQKSAIFQSASDFASASSVYIRTRRPRFADGKQQNWRAKAKYGASDLLRLSTLYERQLGDSLCLSLNAEFLTSSGKYHFTYQRKNLDGTIAWDTTAVRQNGDIHAERVEANLHGVLARGTWMLKGYAYHSQRGIPGAIVNNVWRRGERQGDLNTFVQGQWQRSLGNVFSTKWLAKYAYYNTHYVNRDSTLLPVDNRYRQQEAFLSSANVVELRPNWSASLAYDLRWNHLNADTYRVGGRLQSPRRFTHALSLATAIDYRRLKAQASVVETVVSDRTGSGSQHVSRLTPALFVAVYPLAARRSPLTSLCLRAFAKRSFRMPTFNDLYYTEMGNASLRPESATQFDIGLVAGRTVERGFITHFSLQADIYYNKVRDKIIAYPKGQQFRWTMLNLGRVDIRGLDVVGEASCRLGSQTTATLRAQYTWQRAIDVTDARKPFYKHQIPYMPRHSGTVIAAVQHRGLTLNYSFLYTGERWNEQENTAYNHVQPWYTSDLSASYQWRMASCELRMTAELNNVFNQQYDVITNYPMPGRNAAVSIEVNI